MAGFAARGAAGLAAGDDGTADDAGLLPATMLPAGAPSPGPADEPAGEENAATRTPATIPHRHRAAVMSSNRPEPIRAAQPGLVLTVCCAPLSPDSAEG